MSLLSVSLQLIASKQDPDEYHVFSLLVFEFLVRLALRFASVWSKKPESPMLWTRPSPSQLASHHTALFPVLPGG